MSVHIRYEIQLLCLSFFTGGGLMMSYDIFRAFRVICPHHPIWVGVEDMIYWIYASLITFTLLYRQNDGGLRGFVIAGIFAGMIVYDRLISTNFLKLLKYVCKYFRIKIDKHRKDGDY